MKLFRVFGYSSDAKVGEPGHPQYLHPLQGGNRWDNPSDYRAWYLSTSAAGAVAEVFGNLSRWSEDMFPTPYLPQGRRALAVFHMPDNIPILDLDDPNVLVQLETRPSQVVLRNPGFTQRLAKTVFDLQKDDGERQYDGVKWWSFHRPHRTNVMLWETDNDPAPLELLSVEELSTSHPAVLEAASELTREFRL